MENMAIAEKAMQTPSDMRRRLFWCLVKTVAMLQFGLALVYGAYFSGDLLSALLSIWAVFLISVVLAIVAIVPGAIWLLARVRRNASLSLKDFLSAAAMSWLCAIALPSAALLVLDVSGVRAPLGEGIAVLALLAIWMLVHGGLAFFLLQRSAR